MCDGGSYTTELNGWARSAPLFFKTRDGRLSGQAETLLIFASNEAKQRLDAQVIRLEWASVRADCTKKELQSVTRCYAAFGDPAGVMARPVMGAEAMHAVTATGSTSCCLGVKKITAMNRRTGNKIPDVRTITFANESGLCDSFCVDFIYFEISSLRNVFCTQSKIFWKGPGVHKY